MLMFVVWYDLLLSVRKDALSADEECLTRMTSSLGIRYPVECRAFSQ
jgi:hypothetical protein